MRVCACCRAAAVMRSRPLAEPTDGAVGRTAARARVRQLSDQAVPRCAGRAPRPAAHSPESSAAVWPARSAQLLMPGSWPSIANGTVPEL